MGLNIAVADRKERNQAHLCMVCVNLVQAKREQSILGTNIKPLVALIQQHGLGLK